MINNYLINNYLIKNYFIKKYLIWVIIIIIIILLRNKYNEGFNNDIELLKYDKYKIDKLDLKKQRFLMYLDNINNEYKERMPKTDSVFQGTCDDKLNEKIQKETLKSVYSKMKPEEDYKKYKLESSSKDVNGGVTQGNSLDCVGISSYLCEYTNPYLYLSESKYFPPQWLVKTYKDIPLPKNVDLNCYNKTNDCCKWSLKIDK